MWRYAVVKIVSKGEYAIATLVTYTNYGINYAFYAFAVSFFFSNIIDFFGLKFWAFKNKIEFFWKEIMHALLYALIRSINTFLAASLFFVLTQYLEMNIFVAGAIMAIILIPTGFLLYRWLFVGTLRDLKATLKGVE